MASPSQPLLLKAEAGLLRAVPKPISSAIGSPKRGRRCELGHPSRRGNQPVAQQPVHEPGYWRKRRVRDGNDYLLRAQHKRRGRAMRFCYKTFILPRWRC